MRLAKWAARMGATFYVLWGVYHLGAVNAVYRLASQTDGMVWGRLMQDASYMLFLAVSGIAIAVLLNWRNDRRGYWVNGVLVASGDLPFVFFVLVPGLMPLWPGTVGPLLWVLGFFCTMIGRLSARVKTAAPIGDL